MRRGHSERTSRLPLRGLTFERRRWRIQRERQAAAIRKCESEQPKHERRAARGQSCQALQDKEGLTEGEITRAYCLHRGVDEHRVKKRSFAFTLAYIKCFRTYSVYLSFRLPAQILYAGIHLPPQREARALPRHALKSTASERKIVTKETHQGWAFV